MEIAGSRLCYGLVLPNHSFPEIGANVLSESAFQTLVNLSFPVNMDGSWSQIRFIRPLMQLWNQSLAASFSRAPRTKRPPIFIHHQLWTINYYYGSIINDRECFGFPANNILSERPSMQQLDLNMPESVLHADMYVLPKVIMILSRTAYMRSTLDSLRQS